MIRREAWTAERHQRLQALLATGMPVVDIAAEMGTSRGAIYRASGPSFQPKLSAKSVGTRERDLSGQRRFKAYKASGTARSILREDHPAVVEGRTTMPASLIHASVADSVLKSGQWSSKTGKLVKKGRWRGFPIYTLTLEERATCPRTCLEWRTCYGSNMPYAKRIIADGVFENRLSAELEALNTRHPHGFVIRLHILGDFYSSDYVDLWEGALLAYPALRVFGYTARSPFDEIGGALFRLSSQQWDRFAIRFSGGGFATMCAEVIASVDDTENLICPAQTGRVGCCAECALCWQTERTIAFLRH